MKYWLPPVSGHGSSAMPTVPRRYGTLVQLVADGVTRSAFAVAARIAVLHDEVRHDAVDAEAVEVAPCAPAR